MNEVNRTLYIPLRGKAAVSRMDLFFRDPKAEEIWHREGFPLRGKAKSKWLAYHMAMRAAVFDEWLAAAMAVQPQAVVLHLGCGLDSRILRVGDRGHRWYDVDLPAVIDQRRQYYQEAERCHMLAADLRDPAWTEALPAGGPAIVVMEGVSMYLTGEELTGLLQSLRQRFSGLSLLMDCYTELAARLSKYKNPVNQVGVTTLYGLDDPRTLAGAHFLAEHDLTPERMIARLPRWNQLVFRILFGGRAAKSIYRLYEFKA